MSKLPQTQVAFTPPNCPHCKIRMMTRRGKTTRFFGCVNYPRCALMSWIDELTGLPLGEPFDGALNKARMAAGICLSRLLVGADKKSATKIRRLLKDENGRRITERTADLTHEECNRIIAFFNDFTEVQAAVRKELINSAAAGAVSSRANRAGQILSALTR